MPRMPASASGVSTQRDGAEPVEQTGRRAEHAAGAADVFAEHHHVVVAFELGVERRVHRFDEGQLSHVAGWVAGRRRRA